MNWPSFAARVAEQSKRNIVRQALLQLAQSLPRRSQ